MAKRSSRKAGLSPWGSGVPTSSRSEEHTSELQSQSNLVCRLLLEKKNPTLRRCFGRHCLTCPEPARQTPSSFTINSSFVLLTGLQAPSRRVDSRGCPSPHCQYLVS